MCQKGSGMNKKRFCIFSLVMLALAVGGILYFAFAPKLKCLDGTSPDEYGCCAGEVYTDMGEMGWNCCPVDGDCFPPIK